MIANAAVQAAAKGRVVIDLRPLAEEAFRLEGLRVFKVIIALVDVADVAPLTMCLLGCGGAGARQGNASR